MVAFAQWSAVVSASIQIVPPALFYSAVKARK